MLHSSDQMQLLRLWWLDCFSIHITWTVALFGVLQWSNQTAQNTDNPRHRSVQNMTNSTKQTHKLHSPNSRKTKLSRVVRSSTRSSKLSHFQWDSPKKGVQVINRADQWRDCPQSSTMTGSGSSSTTIGPRSLSSSTSTGTPRGGSLWEASFARLAASSRRRWALSGPSGTISGSSET